VGGRAKIVQLVRTLISCVKNENSSFSLGSYLAKTKYLGLTKDIKGYLSFHIVYSLWIKLGKIQRILKVRSI
jgi:hypothetical protein